MESSDPRWVRNRFAVALASVFHFWDRYFVGFVPLLVVWTANGIDVMVEAVQNRSAARWLGFVPTALVAVFLLTLLFSTKVRFLDDSSTTIEQQGGLWLAEHGGRGSDILSISDQAVFYAGGVWSMLPYAPDEGAALRYVQKEHPTSSFSIVNTRPSGPT